MKPAAIALTTFAYFVIAVTGLYFLNPAYSLINSFVGNYDLGGHEFLIASTFFSLGLGSLALAVGLHQAMPQTARSRIGLLFLGFGGIGMLAAGIFPANAGGGTVPHTATVLLAGLFPVEVLAVPETDFSFIHIIAILGSFFSLSLAAIVLSRRFKDEEKWRVFHRFSLILGLVMAAGSILLFIPTEGAFILCLELLTFSSLYWLFLIAARLWFVDKSVSKG